MEHKYGTPSRWRRRRRLVVSLSIALVVALTSVLALGITGTLPRYFNAKLVEAARPLPPRPPSDSDYFGLTTRGQLELPYGMIYVDTDGDMMHATFANEAQHERETTRKLWYLRMALRLDPGNAEAALDLGYALHLLGRHEEAVPYLEQASGRAGHPRYLVALAKSYERLGLIDKAIETVRYDTWPHVRYHLGYLMQREGRLQEAGRIYDELSHSQSVSTQLRAVLDKRAENLLAGTQSLGMVFGRIAVDGEGVPGAEVFVFPDATQSYGSRSLSGAPEVMAVTNPDGTFRLYGVPPGEYRLGAHIPFERIAGTDGLIPHRKLTVEPGQEVEVNLSFERPPRVKRLEWIDAEPQPMVDIVLEPHGNLAAYDLFVNVGVRGAGHGRGISDWMSLMTSESSAQIPLDGRFFLNRHGWGTNAEGEIELAYLFGLLHPEAEISASFQRKRDTTDPTAWWRAMPEDPDQAASPTLEPPNFTLSKADRLLLDRKYDEAVAAYEQQLAANPDDAHALTVLGYLFYYGVDSRGTYKDPQRAVMYTDRLAEVQQRTQ